MTRREHLQAFIERPMIQNAIVGVIVVNAITLGLETSSTVMGAVGGVLTVLDKAALTIFVVELLIKLFAFGPRFFRDPWNVFDFIVVGVSVAPLSPGLSVLRALRILRALRLVSAVPSMKRVVVALLKAIPGVSSILGLLGLIIYVAGVMATKLFSDVPGAHFDTLGHSLWTLFQVMTGEAWPDIASAVMEDHPFAWIFFLVYILISTFVVLNLFLAVVVGAMEESAKEEREEERAIEHSILHEIQELRREVHALRAGRTGE